MRENQTAQPEGIAALMRYLDCPCRYFAPMADDDPLMEAYREAQARGPKEGFVPMLVTEDETLWECLVMDAEPESDGTDDFQFDPAKVAAYRREMLETPLPEGKEVAAELLKLRREEAEEDELDWDAEILGKVEGGEAIDQFCGYWDFETRNTTPLILAEIPVKHPWEVFAWLPFGGWNECPDTPELMAVSKYWFEQYGAVPAVMTHDVLEFDVPAPVRQEDAIQLALEQYVWCPDRVDQCTGDDACVGNLADTLTKSHCWYFWWD